MYINMKMLLRAVHVYRLFSHACVALLFSAYLAEHVWLSSQSEYLSFAYAGCWNPEAK